MQLIGPELQNLLFLQEVNIYPAASAGFFTNRILEFVLFTEIRCGQVVRFCVFLK